MPVNDPSYLMDALWEMFLMGALFTNGKVLMGQA